MAGFLKHRRRERLRRQAFPQAWLELVERNVPYYTLLTPEERAALHGHVQVFLAEKEFEGCSGFEITDEVRLTVAAQACLLLLNLDADYFPRLKAILVYPGAFVAPDVEFDQAGVVSEIEDVREGESWTRGALVLSWSDVVRDTQAFDGRNVVLHEFAHQMDQAGQAPGGEASGDGDSDGWPEALDPALNAEWAEVMGREYERLVSADRRGLRTFLDPYGATSPAEFFAVVTEAFFECPSELQNHHAALYEVFKKFFRQDPVQRFVGGRGKRLRPG